MIVRRPSSLTRRPAAPGRRSPRPLVAVVDDEPDVCDAIAMTLKSAGFRAAVYTDPSAFLENVSRLDAACILLDVRMPRLSGLEVQRALASGGIDTPVVFVSGHGDIPMAVTAVRAGALQFLEKPFHAQALVDAVREAAAEGRRRRRASTANEKRCARVWRRCLPASGRSPRPWPPARARKKSAASSASAAAPWRCTSCAPCGAWASDHQPQ